MNASDWQLSCPVPSASDDRVTLAHGEGGRLMRRLIGERVLPALGSVQNPSLGDAAIVEARQSRLAVTTDSFVIAPRFFPGGDIGKLAVCGTVNDLAVSGAVPRWITLSLIIEEGFDTRELERILQSVARAAADAEVRVVAGDTKVVPRGAADGLFINTTGVGERREDAPPGPAALQPGDVLLVSGPIGQHGMAVLASRDDLGFEPLPQSDCGSLLQVATALQDSCPGLRAMRDATRGGVTAVLHEWAGDSGHTLRVHETEVPVSGAVRSACELLGLDPLHVANEGTLVAAVAAESRDAALAALRALSESSEAAVIGEVVPRDVAAVTIRRSLGRDYPLDEPLGAPLPRIC